MRNDRFYLLRRRIRMAFRFHQEFGWAWRICWEFSALNQRHMLSILTAIREEEAAVAELRRELEQNPHALMLSRAV